VDSYWYYHLNRLHVLYYFTLLGCAWVVLWLFTQLCFYVFFAHSRELLLWPVWILAADDNGSQDEDAAFLNRRQRAAPPASATRADELAQYLTSTSTDTCSIAAWPTLKRLFVQLNTPLPASAAAERMFSCAGLTKTCHRVSMCDSLFEHLVLLKKKKSLWA